ncbi:hypothetical protein EVAR_94943_1 [Eumeta japonica]|uniref:Uncharacterized protein n=1 Tax=Eumeta variegata TaxID=151549 RepID=A0A4C1UV40_EUMVA|nr:hypothetical protein EVAR_94943_1 [Eumeta japonica]
MCGDHPSFTKSEANMKSTTSTKKSLDSSSPNSSPRPSLSKPERDVKAGAQGEGAATECGANAMQLEGRRVVSLGAVSRDDGRQQGPVNKILVQAALGSFRWPPYLVAVWVLLLIMTHALHCLVTVLTKALPYLKNACAYFRGWTENCWTKESASYSRLHQIALTVTTGLLYIVYFFTYTLYSITLWSVEPLSYNDTITDKAASELNLLDKDPLSLTKYNVDGIISQSKTK